MTAPEPMTGPQRAATVRAVQLGLGDVARALRRLIADTDDSPIAAALDTLADNVDRSIDLARDL